VDQLLTVDASRVGGRDVLAVAGELDMASAPVLRDAIDSVLAAGESHLILDLSGVGFLDSAGLRVLVTAHRALTDQRGGLRIVCNTERVREVFRISNLDEVFVVFDSVDAALDARE